MTMTATAPFRCHECGLGLESMGRAEKHVDTVHGHGRIEFVLTQTERGRTGAAALPHPGAKPPAREDSGVRTRDTAPSEGTGSALPDERPSDDNRALYEPPKKLPRHKRGPKIPAPPTPKADLPKKPTPEEREVARKKIAQLRRTIEERKS